MFEFEDFDLDDEVNKFYLYYTITDIKYYVCH